jgi:nitrogen fixation NifU-like protein
MNDQLKALYQKVLMDRQRSEQGFARRSQAQEQVEAYNPLCGDQFTLFFDRDNERLKDISFHGYGCAISKASTSLLVEELEGCTTEEAQSRINAFLSMMQDDAEPTDELRQALAISRNFPGRAQCAELSWKAALEYLESTK